MGPRSVHRETPRLEFRRRGSRGEHRLRRDGDLPLPSDSCGSCYSPARVRARPRSCARPILDRETSGSGVRESIPARQLCRRTVRSCPTDAAVLANHGLEFLGIALFAPNKPYDAIVSALAIHHLPDSGKRHLFADIFNYLTPGGAVINADQVAGEGAAIDDRARQMWIKRARELQL